MYCPNCGAQNVDTNRFCLKCGTALPKVDEVNPLTLPITPSVSPAIPGPVAPTSSRRRNGLLIGLVGLAALAAIAAFVVLIYNGQLHSVDQVLRSVDPSLMIGIPRGTSIVLTTANDSRTLTLSETIRPIELAVSPDGHQVAFVASDAEGYTLNVVNVDGSALTQLVRRPGEILSGPAWSPDNQHLAFVIGGNGNADIYAVNIDGRGLTRLTNQPTIDAAPAWSPDGTRLAFYSDRTGTPEIFLMKTDGSDVTPVTHSGGLNVDPAWSPDGTRLAFASQRDGNFEIYTLKIDETDEVQLTNSPEDERHPVWSADGATVAFVSNNRLMLMKSDGSAPAQSAGNLDANTRSFVGWLTTARDSTASQASPIETPASLVQISPLATLPPLLIDTPLPAPSAHQTQVASLRILLPLITRGSSEVCRDSSPYQLNQDLLAGLGCPGQDFIANRKIILQRFQNGAMVIFAKPNNVFDSKGGGFIYVLANDGRAWRTVDTFIERTANHSSWYACQSKSNDGPEATGVPWRGFGKVWCEHKDVRDALGRAQSAELAGSTASFQSYDSGRAFQISDWRGTPSWSSRDIVVVTFPSVEGDFLSGQWIRKK